jgi:chromosome segregation ATPase
MFSPDATFSLATLYPNKGRKTKEEILKERLVSLDKSLSFDELSSCHSHICSVVEELKKLNHQLGNNVPELEGLKITTPELQVTIEKLKKLFTDFTHKLDELEEICRQQKDELTKKIKEREIYLEEMKIELERYHQTNNILSQTIKEKQKEIFRLKYQLTLKENIEKNMKKMEEEARRLKGENLHLQAELVKLEKLKGLDEINEKLKMKVTVLENKLKKESTLLAKLKADYEFLEAEYKHLFGQA